MTRGKRWILVLCAGLTAAFSPRSAAAGPAARTVVLISIDGLAASDIDDARLTLPTLRRMAGEGARARAVKVAFPSVTQTNHATLITGVWPAKHGILANKLYDRGSGRAIRPHVHRPSRARTLLQVSSDAGLQPVCVSWPGEAHEGNFGWEPFYRRQGWNVPGLPGETERKDEGMFSGEESGKLEADLLNAEIARQILGASAPDLLLLRFASSDAVKHNFGPHSPEAAAVLRKIDSEIGQLIDAVRESGRLDRTTFLVASDHGFLPYTKRINLNWVLRNEGLAADAGEAIRKHKVWFVAHNGAGFLYVLDLENRDAILRRLGDQLKAVEGVESVFQTADFARLHVPLPEDDSCAPDLMVAARPGYGFSASPTPKNLISEIGSVRGAHGYAPEHDAMDAVFVAWGPGVKSGADLGAISITDVAPAAAALLGVSLPGADGRIPPDLLSHPNL